MLLLKLHYHFIAFLKLLLYKCIYAGRLKTNGRFTFRKGFTLAIESKGKITVGRNCFFNNFCTLASRDSIIIGDGTIFGENVKIYDHNHLYQDTDTPIKDQGYNTSPVIIGKHCWISSNVVILKGVIIGDNCVIGSGCVIYQNIPSNSVIANKQNIIFINK